MGRGCRAPPYAQARTAGRGSQRARLLLGRPQKTRCSRPPDTSTMLHQVRQRPEAGLGSPGTGPSCSASRLLGKHPQTSLGLGFLIPKTGGGTEPWGRPGPTGLPLGSEMKPKAARPRAQPGTQTLDTRTETLLTLRGWVALREMLRPHRAPGPPLTALQARRPPWLVPGASRLGANTELPPRRAAPARCGRNEGWQPETRPAPGRGHGY